MKTSEQNSLVTGSVSGEFENTLRLIARLSPPEGLEERMHAGLRAEADTTPGKTRILRWPEAQWIQNLARAAAAAAIVTVVVGGGWGVLSRFQPSQPSSAIAVPQHGGAQGGFSSAGAMRTPQTLNGPVVAHPATATPEMNKAAVKKPIRHGKPATGKKAVAQKSALKKK